MEDDSQSLDTKNSKTNSILNELKQEWQLFWAALSGDEDDTTESENIINEGISQNPDYMKVTSKRLSSERSLLFNKLESLKKEMDLNQAKLTSLKLVGGDIEETEIRLDVLNAQGQKLSQQLEKIDQQMRELRSHEEDNSL